MKQGGHLLQRRSSHGFQGGHLLQRRPSHGFHSVGAAFRLFLAGKLKELGFVSSQADPEV